MDTKKSALRHSSARARQDLNRLIVDRIRDKLHSDPESPSGRSDEREYEDEAVLEHLGSLPPKYGQELNLGNPFAVLIHMEILDRARGVNGADDAATESTGRKDHPDVPVFSIRPLQPEKTETLSLSRKSSRGSLGRNNSSAAFGSQADLVALAGSEGASPSPINPSPLASSLGDSPSNEFLEYTSNSMFNDLYEITFAGRDVKGILCTLTSTLTQLDLDVLNAQVFTTKDKYFLDSFVVAASNDGLKTNDSDSEDGSGSGRNHASNSVLHALDEKLHAVLYDTFAKPKQGDPSRSPSFSGQASPAASVPQEWNIAQGEVVLGEKIAEGSFGIVHKGMYFGQSVAVKVLKGVDHLGSVETEISILRRVRHKNVVQFMGITDLGCGANPLCMVMEFMNGGTLFDYCRQRFKMVLPDLKFILTVALDVAHGMEYLHRKGIIHRDLKSSNLLVSTDAQGLNPLVKVSDFGVSRFMAQATTADMTAETGTYRFMAPEMIKHEKYDNEVDVYSYGIFLWELCTMSQPYSNLTPLQAAMKVVNGERPPISSDCPQELAQIMTKCWAHYPIDRPTFSDIVLELENLLSGTSKPKKINSPKKKFFGVRWFGVAIKAVFRS